MNNPFTETTLKVSQLSCYKNILFYLLGGALSANIVFFFLFPTKIVKLLILPNTSAKTHLNLQNRLRYH